MKEVNNQIPNNFILSKYNTSMIQRRIVYAVLMQIEKVMEYTPVPVDDLKFEIPKAMIVDGYNFTDLKKSCKDLLTKLLTVKENDGDEEFHFILPFTEVCVKKDSPNIEIYLNKKVAKIFYEIKKGYTKIEYESALSLESKHAQKLYELFSMKINNFDSTIWFSTIEEIKEILGVSDKYKQNLQFVDMVLKTIQKEINEHTNLTVEYELEKKGKSYHYLNFHLFRKKENTDFQKIELALSDDRSKRCLEELIKIGIVDKNLQKNIIDNYQIEFWKWNYAVKTNKIAIKSNASGHLLKTLGLVTPKS